MGRCHGTGRRVRALLGILTVVAVVIALAPPAGAEVLGGAPANAGAAPPVTSPQQGTPDSLDGLQYGDPAAGLDLVDEPATDSYGAAQLRHPIDLPTGRLNWQPQIQLAYSSDGEDDWLGEGWDLSLDAIKVPGLGSDVSADSIEVDTRWGVPTYDKNDETETYLFGGEQLAPNAHRSPGSPAIPRTGERVFTKRVEGDFLHIVRHGDSPDDYWWEVQDKLGDKYFYGGVLDDVAEGGSYTGMGHQVDNAVLRSADGHAYWWGLTEKWDISSNVVTYTYDKSTGDTGVTTQDGSPQADAPKGTELYLKNINYTGSRLRSEFVPDGGHLLPRYGPYDVTFVRDSDLGEPRRPDATIDGSHGGLEISADLLRQVKITYTPKGSETPQLVRRYDLGYEIGSFGKELLKSVTKTDAEGKALSTNTFDYYDDVKQDGHYEGFGATEKWHPAGENDDDSLSQEFLGVPTGTALGATRSIGGDGRMFLGASLFSPDKLLAAGGGIQLGGSNGKSTVEFIDINGDNLPDKVWQRPSCDSSGASVCYRLNTARPNASTDEIRFGPLEHVDDLSHLSEDNEFSVGAGPEAYVGGSVMYNHTWTFSKQTSYFSDVNADGLPDLVRDGDVLFNHLSSSGAISFDKNSGTTAVPIEQDNKLPVSIVPTHPEVAQEQAGEFPRQDTLRRWVAPADGDIEITAPVHLVSPNDSPDGVRVAIQHNGAELWVSDIDGGDASEHVPANVDDIHVDRGDRIYFRVGSRDNGAGDRVSWNPTIHYRGHGAHADVNGKDIYNYTASDDFTLAGLDGTVIAMPYDGHVVVSGSLVKTKPTSDDVHVKLSLNGVVVKELCVRGSSSEPEQADCDGPAGQADTGEFPFETEFDVTGRHHNAAGDLVPGDKLNFHLSVSSNVDPGAISWTPTLRYASATDEDGNALHVVDNAGEPTMVLKAPYDFDLYPNTNVSLPQGTDDEESVGIRFEVDRDDIPKRSLPAKMTFTAKTDDGVLRFKHTFTIPAGDGVYTYPGPCDPINGLCPQDGFKWDGHTGSHDAYYDFTFHDGAVARATKPLVDLGSVPAAKWWPGVRVLDDAVDVFPPPYRGWGYAGYNADGQRAIQPINEQDLLITKDEVPDPNSRPTSHDDPGYTNPVNGQSYPFGPLPANGLWIGAKFDDSNPTADPEDQTPCAWPFTDCLAPRGTWGGPDEASASLLGGDELGAVNPNQIVTGDASAPVLYGKADADSLSAELLGLGGGFSTGRSDSVVDFMDLNADGYPDTVTQTGVVYTNQNGGLTAGQPDPGLDGIVRADHEFADQAGAGGSPAAISTGSDGKGAGASGTGDGGGQGGSKDAGKNGKTKKRKAGKMLGDLAKSLGIGGELGHQSTNSQADGVQPDCMTMNGDCNTQIDLADLNGDGLPDRVRVSKSGEIHVRWNLGYSFTQKEAFWAKATLDEGSSTSTALDVGLGFGDGLLDFSGGVDLSKDDERTEVTWADVNGDDLDDLLVAHVDPVTGDASPSDDVDVHLNTGSGLSSIPGSRFGNFLDNQVSRTQCTGIGGGADFTIGIPIFEIYYILINPGFHVSKGNCSPSNDLVDVNGDGYLDSVSSSDDGHLTVAPNTTGRTNLLKTVHRPLGGRIDLDYTRAGNTTDHPSSLYVLSKVVVDDGHAGDGADKQLTTYQYDGPRESYAEREDYGFHKVTEEQRDPATDEVYRSWERVYDNRTYYGRGLLQSETLLDGDGKAVTSTRNTYRMVDSGTGEPAGPDGLTSLSGSVFPQLATMEQRWHDANGDVAKSAEMDYAYDRRGNLVEVSDLGEPGTAADDVTATMTYPDCTPGVDPDTGEAIGNEEYPWTQAPANSLLVRSGSKVLQRRTSVVGCDTASVAEVDDYLDPTSNAPDKVAVTYVCYLPVGGQTSAVVGPLKSPATVAAPCDSYGAPSPDLDGYAVTYGYSDPDELGAFVSRSTDSFGLATASRYDNRFGRLVSTTDPVGAKTSYEYDVANRLTAVTGPLEQGSGDKTITYAYHPDAAVPWALAKHIDPANPGTTIDTVAFVDGLEREIETKHDASVFTAAGTAPDDRMVVEDQVSFDAFDRPVTEFYATDEPVGTPGEFHAGTDPHATQTQYDVLDRTTRVAAPGDRVTDVSYGFATGPFSDRMFTVFADTPGQPRTRSYQDVRQNTVATELLHTANGSDQPLLTRYEYDPLQRLTNVTAPGQRTTTATYDLLGRRTSVDNPDAGRTTFGYDLASNVISETTANLRAANKKITYGYDLNRLKTVHYPNNPQNDVTYTYGAPGADEHGAGQVIRVDDGSRTESIGYDLLGNAVREKDLMKVSNLTPATEAAHTFTTRYDYDTWGRELGMTYPDGEQLRTTYDSGGLAQSVTGKKDGVTYPYVKRSEYDRFGNHRYQEYANGLSTEMSYDPDTLWFSDQRVQKGASILSDLHYKYDLAGNVLGRDDTRPVPPSSQMGGPSAQSFTYDDLDRLTSATGTYSDASKKTRTYSSATTFDATGRVTRKTQTDKIATKVQAPTSYDFSYQYGAPQPHAASHIGSRTETWDLDGNLTGWKEDKSTTRRTVGWDEDDRMTSVTDGGSTATYRYDADDDLSIRRGPQGETEFVNDEYTAMNGGVAWKSIFLNDERVAVKRVGDAPEDLQYYLTNDLTESNFLVTDALGKLFEHSLFFPGGEFWVRENSNVQRERYVFAGSYLDETKQLHGMGDRWYEPREGTFYSADPVLVGDLESTVDDPALSSAFSYVEDNPTTYVDPLGDQKISAQLSHRMQSLGAQVEVAASRAYLGAYRAYNSPEMKAFRDRYVDKAFAEASDRNKKRSERAETVLGFLAGPPLFELSLAADGNFTLAETDFKIAGVGFRDVGKLVKRLRR
ncbi:RHS repeat-associated protein [Marmoricola sp. URHA0025 HA25]